MTETVIVALKNLYHKAYLTEQFKYYFTSNKYKIDKIQEIKKKLNYCFIPNNLFINKYSQCNF